MDTILLATMILLTPLSGIWAFIMSEMRPAGPSVENVLDLRIGVALKAAYDCALTPEQEASLALNRIWGILLTPEERGAV